MNNFKKIFSIVLVFCLFIIGSVYAKTVEYTDEETNYQLLIEDDANLLTDSDIDKLMTDMQPLTQYGNIVFKSISENSTSAQNFAKDYYHGKYGIMSGSLFLIDMDSRIIYIFF